MEIKDIVEAFSKTFKITYYYVDSNYSVLLSNNKVTKSSLEYSIYKVLIDKCFTCFDSYIIMDSSNYTAMGIYDPQKNICYVLSNFFTENSTKDQITKSLHKSSFTYEFANQFADVMLNLSKLSLSDIMNIFNCLCYTVNIDYKEKSFEEVILIKNDKNVYSRLNKYQLSFDAYEDYLPFLQNGSMEKYQKTRMLLNYIVEKKYDSINTILTINKDIFDENNYEFFIEVLTLVSNCAYDNGVELELIEAMKAFYIDRYNKIRTNIFNDMIIDFMNKIIKIDMIENCSTNIKKALAYIEYHIREEIVIEELSDILGVSKNYLLSSFKHEVGISMVDYIQYWKIELAKDLLDKTDFNLIDISNSLSFCNQSYFGRVFKKFTHRTPLSYKNRNK